MRFCSAAVLALVFACHRGGEEEQAPAGVPVSTQRVTRGDVSAAVQATGELVAVPGSDVKLGPLVAGRLGEVLVAEGDRVQKGQLLARLDVTPLRDAVSQAEAQFAQARAQEANARARLLRAEKALQAGVAAAQEVEDDRLALSTAQAAVRSAQAALSTARNQLGRSELRAPFAGVVAHVFVAPGEPVDANKAVVEVARTEELEVRAPVAPAVAATLKPGQRAELRVDGLPGRTFPARVVAVAPTIDPASGSALVRLRVDNAGGALRLGAFAHARIETDLRHDVLRVPRAALLGGEQPAVEVVESGKAKRKPVQVGAQDENFAEIVSGLAEGDTVIVQGAYALPDGTPVREEKREGEPVRVEGSK
ncbi:MAG TPA: efflux RND transporter periplasmic adaptor subunit [Myxococcales bacterium]